MVHNLAHLPFLKSEMVFSAIASFLRRERIQKITSFCSKMNLKPISLFRLKRVIIG
jgi:hypothetical protein